MKEYRETIKVREPQGVVNGTNKVRVICTTTTRWQQCSRVLVVTDNVPPLRPSPGSSSRTTRKHITTISFPQKMDQPQISTPLETTYSQEQTYIQAQSYIQNQNYPTPAYTQVQTVTHERDSITDILDRQYKVLHNLQYTRKGDLLKRPKTSPVAYELSQDLLDKQIEMLERKYGGVRARNAALTIQRAFRRYTLLKKFAAITAMAKAEKRISRRLPNAAESDGTSGTNVEGSQCDKTNFTRSYDNGHECLSSVQGNRPLPVRSMSLRERRTVDNIPLPRSQSGTANTCWDNCTSSQITRHPQLIYIYSQCNNSGSKQNYSGQQVSPSYQLWNRTENGQVTCSSTSGISESSQDNCRGSQKKVPPEVPKRTSSISSRSMEPRQHRTNGLSKSTENGSLSSVQSSGSDSSISTERDRFSSASPVWKRIGNMPEGTEMASETSQSSGSAAFERAEHTDHLLTVSSPAAYQVRMTETVRKRHYRVGLNLFNKRPEKGVAYLMKRGFLESSPQGVARFLISRKGLSKQMIGEYLGNLQNPFCMAVLSCFARELDLSSMQVDVALRKFQTYFRMPGEAQKIERLMEVFSHRYCECNMDVVSRLRSPETVFVLAFAIIMLNTDLHTPNLKPERRMKLEDFIKNLRGIDDCGDIDSDMLGGIYERVKGSEFKPGSDHVTQVMKVQATIVGKKPNLALPHRRLVCYCRLYEIPDIYKKERPGVHQREVFLFNDLLVITKILNKKKNSVTYTFRQSFPLCGMFVSLYNTPYYSYGIRLQQRVDGKILVTFNARNDHDRIKFFEDLQESVMEMDEMESLRIEAELERQNSNRGNRAGTENRDSGVADVEVCPCSQNQSLRSTVEGGGGVADDPVHENQLKRSALSNSLLDIHEQFAGDKGQRRGSVGSLDSGMSVSFQSTSTSTCSRMDKTTPGVAGIKGKNVTCQQSFLSGLFNKRERNFPRSAESSPFVKSTEV